MDSILIDFTELENINVVTEVLMKEFLNLVHIGVHHNGFMSKDRACRIFRVLNELSPYTDVVDFDTFPVDVDFVENYVVDTSYVDEDRVIFGLDNEFDVGYKIHVDDYSKYSIDRVRGDKIVFGWGGYYSTNVEFRPVIFIVGSDQVDDIQDAIDENKTVV